MTVDPILPLSISIAEGERTYAVFLGSGISRTAGIPTGGEILNNTIELLYEMEHHVDKLEDETAKEWFEKSKYKNWGYSEILESLRETPEERRKFLEKFFIGKKPTEAHNIIAEMVEKNLIKCIITTNFDRLMEQSLDDKGIHYDVVASETDLNELKPREHCNCRIYKLHGDYQKSNIKNTKKELENLEKKLEKEFKEILNNYGIITIGYSGSDNGVMNCFEDRKNQRYTLYWLTREKISDRVKELLQQQNGKKLVRDSANEFLNELSRKIEIFQTHKTGETPEFIIQEVKGYIRDYDYVNFRETLKKQMKIIETKYYEICEKTDNLFKAHEDYEEYSSITIKFIEPNVSEKVNKSLNTPIEGFKEYERFTDILIGIGLTLIEFNTKEFFNETLKSIQKFYDLPILRNIDPRVSNISKASIHNIYYIWGAYALKEKKFDILKTILTLNIMLNDTNPIEYKPVYSISNIFYPKTFKESNITIFNFLKESYNYKEFLNEFFSSYKDFIMYLYQFNLVMCLYDIQIKENDDSEFKLEVSPEFSKLAHMHHFLTPFFVNIKHAGSSGFVNFTSNIFGVKPSSFITHYPTRCKKINEYIKDSFEYHKLPCDFFEKID